MRQRTNTAQAVRELLDVRGESIEWLSCTTGIESWRLFSVIEMEADSLTLAEGVAVADAFGIELTRLIYRTEDAA